MEAQLHRDQDHPPQHDSGLRSVVEGEGGEYDQQHQGDKKSVLKKVKDKAKKIKNTITKHGHGHEQEHHSTPEEEEEDDDGEEIVQDPGVHGGPVIESTVIRSTNLPRQVNLENPTDTSRTEQVNPNVTEQGMPRPSAPAGLRASETEKKLQKDPSPTAPTAMDVDEPMTKMSRPPRFDEETTRPSATGQSGPGLVKTREPKVKIGPPMGLEEDPHSPKSRPGDIPPSNYQSKVVDPTGDGGKEAEVEPLLHRLDNLNLGKESESKPVSEKYTGSHEQFAPQSTPTKDEFNPVSEEKAESNPKILESVKADERSVPRDTVAGKISSATAVITDKAISAKNVVASKLGYGGSAAHPQEEGKDGTQKKPVSETATEYAHVVAEKLAPVYGTVAGAGAAVMSKVHGGGGGGGEHPVGDTAQKGSDKGVSVKEYLSETFKPGDEDKELSEVITGALHMKKKEEKHVAVEEPRLGKVTESEEVAARLGTGTEGKREGEDALAAGSESSGAGVVERVKDAVSSWLGKSTGIQTAQESVGQSYVSPTGAGGAPTGVAGHGGEEVTEQRK